MIETKTLPSRCPVKGKGLEVPTISNGESISNLHPYSDAYVLRTSRTHSLEERGVWSPGREPPGLMAWMNGESAPRSRTSSTDSLEEWGEWSPGQAWKL